MTPSRLLAIVLATVLAFGWFSPPAQAVPLQVPVPPQEGLVVPSDPDVSAASWVVYDADAELSLASRHADTRRPMASTTKVMTALVILKYGDLDDRVTVSKKAADVGEAEVGLVAGERLALRQLLSALVIRSANDAAMAAAEHISGSVDAFVDLMNAEAEELGLENTHFDNPHGLDADDHYSSANDLLQMSLAAMAYPEFRQLATTRELDFPDAPDGTARPVESTNRLLENYPGAIGVKTGYTDDAGLVLVAGATREGRTLFSVVMGSDGQRAHFNDAEALLDWGFRRFRSVALVTTASYEPPEPVRVEADTPVAEPQPEPEPEPVVVTNVRNVDEPPPPLMDAFGWVGRFIGLGGGG